MEWSRKEWKEAETKGSEHNGTELVEKIKGLKRIIGRTKYKNKHYLKGHSEKPTFPSLCLLVFIGG